MTNGAAHSTGRGNYTAGGAESAKTDNARPENEGRIWTGICGNEKCRLKTDRPN